MRAFKGCGDQIGIQLLQNRKFLQMSEKLLLRCGQIELGLHLCKCCLDHVFMVQKRICFRQIRFDRATFLCTNGIDIYWNSLILQRFLAVVEQGKQFIFPKISLVFHQNIQIRSFVIIAFAPAAVYHNVFQSNWYLIFPADQFQICSDCFCNFCQTVVF